MNKTIAESWVQELKSGRRKQGMGSLRMEPKDGGEDTYCCLGVLTEMAVEAGVIPAGKINGHDRHSNPRYGYGMELSPTSLCTEVREWAGLKNRWGGFSTGQTLTNLNDEGHDFHYIAEVIHTNAERL